MARECNAMLGLCPVWQIYSDASPIYHPYRCLLQGTWRSSSCMGTS